MRRTFTFLLLFCLVSFSIPILATNSIEILPDGNDKHLSVVSPNPASALAMVRFYNPDGEAHTIEIYDIIGNNVRNYESVKKSSHRIDVSELSSGMYFYFILKADDRVSTGRLIIKR